jgi:hypothetical protein
MHAEVREKSEKQNNTGLERESFGKSRQQETAGFARKEKNRTPLSNGVRRFLRFLRPVWAKSLALRIAPP